MRRMNVSIWTETLPSEFRWDVKDPPPSGTVEFYIETASELAKRHDVSVYYDGEATEYRGAYYLPRELALVTATDVVIACNEYPRVVGDKMIYWNAMVGQKAKDFMNFDHRITLSKYHQSIFGDSTVIGLGVHKEQFSPKKENLCIYTSSPDGIWKLNEFPFEKYGYKFVSTYKQGISEQEMIDLYNRAKFWLHPGQRWELYCLSAIKAQQAKCIPVVVPTMALQETVTRGVKTTLDNYFNDLKKALEDGYEAFEYNAPTWEEQTKKIELLFS